MNHLRRAVIVGITGQDGTLLARNLHEEGYNVIGISSTCMTVNGKLLSSFSVCNEEDVKNLIADYQPSAVYYFAAYHASSEQKEEGSLPRSYQQYHIPHVVGPLNFLSAIYSLGSDCKFFYASSSLIYDGSLGPLQDEKTPPTPVGYYGITKLQGMHLCKYFRETHSIHASSGIMYTHESALRKPHFLSKKLIHAAHNIALGQQDFITLGNLNAQNDWGYAADFVKASEMIINLDHPDDYIIATGELHTVKEFADIVFNCFNLKASTHIHEDSKLLRRLSPPKAGDFSKIRQLCGWKPTLPFRFMVEKLVDDYLKMIHHG